MPRQPHRPNREEALALLHEYVENENLRKHALAVEGVMRHMARKYDGEEDAWGIIGLIHDLDWEKFPERHCTMTRQILEEHEWPSDWIRAVLSHGWGLCTDVQPESTLEKCLFAVDELTGLVTACVLVRPSRSVHDLKPKSVKKKWKVRNFAAGADREIIRKGADMLGVSLDELIADVIAGMRDAAADIGLDGNAV
ncbi:MAG: hydrolase [Kiritimatiellaeota bacterium]|nr:hydrolase [Kiritimatiellota bacterium]